MSVLSNEEIVAIIQGGRNPELRQAEIHEGRLQLHTRATIRRPREKDHTEQESIKDYRNKQRQAYWEFMTLPESLLPVDKFITFQGLITFPLPTVEIVERANEELFKVHQAENRVVDYEFNDQELKEDFDNYLKELQEPSYWRTHGWEIYKNEINGMIVVDLPTLERDENGDPIATSERPEPYFYFLPTTKIHNVKNNERGECEWVSFYESPLLTNQQIQEQTGDEEDKTGVIFVIIDDQSYRRFMITEDDEVVQISQNDHNLGYCPARSFWSQPLGTSRIQRQNQTTNNLGALDWMLYSKIVKRHLDLYAGFPIISMFEQKCTYRENGWFCESGQLHAEDPDKDVMIHNRKACPKCNSGRSLVGPGSIIEAPGAASSDAPDKQMPMVVMTQGDVDSLEAMQEEVERQEENFMVNMLGFGGDPKNDQAKNQKQVMGSFESRTVVLNKLARNFERIQKFTLDTLGDLRYGDAYLGSVVYWGTVFFLQSLENMLEAYEVAKNNGMPNFDLNERRRDIWRKQYNENPERSLRMRMLSDLEPYEDFTQENILNYKAFMDVRLMTLKINFNDLIQRFEIQNGPIQNYLPDLDYDLRIIQIKNQLMEWVDEIVGNQVSQAEQIAQLQADVEQIRSGAGTEQESNTEDNGQETETEETAETEEVTEGE